MSRQTSEDALAILVSRRSGDASALLSQFIRLGHTLETARLIKDALTGLRCPADSCPEAREREIVIVRDLFVNCDSDSAAFSCTSFCRSQVSDEVTDL